MYPLSGSLLKYSDGAKAHAKIPPRGPAYVEADAVWDVYENLLQFDRLASTRGIVPLYGPEVMSVRMRDQIYFGGWLAEAFGGVQVSKNGKNFELFIHKVLHMVLRWHCKRVLSLNCNVSYIQMEILKLVHRWAF